MVARDGCSALCQRTPSKSRWGDAGYYHRLDEPIPPPPPSEPVKQLTPDDITPMVAEWRRGAHLYMLANNLGVSLRSLHALSVGHAFGDVYTYPMRDAANGHFVGVRFRSMDGSKWGLAGGANGLFYDGLVTTAPVAFIPEGPTCTAALMDQGFNVVGRPNDRAKLQEVVALLLKWKTQHAVVVADNDAQKSDGRRPGQEAAEIYFEALKLVVPRVSIIQPKRYKDSRDTVRYGGTRQSIVELFRGRSNYLWELVRTTHRVKSQSGKPDVPPVHHR